MAGGQVTKTASKEGHYSKLGEIYERFDYGPISKQREFYFLMLIDSLSLPKTRAFSVLEVGPGDGRLSNMLGMLYPNAKVLGIDLSEKSIAAAENARKAHGLSNVEFRQGNALENKGQAFDVIIASQSILLYSPNLYEDLKALSSLLNPGGRVAFIATHPESFRGLKAASAKFLVPSRDTFLLDKRSADVLTLIGCRTHFPAEAVNTIQVNVRIPRKEGGTAAAKCTDIKVVESAFSTTGSEYVRWFRNFGEPYKVRAVPGNERPGVHTMHMDEDTASRLFHMFWWGDALDSLDAKRTLYRTAKAVLATAGDGEELRSDRKTAKLLTIVTEIANAREFKEGDRLVELAKPGREELAALAREAFGKPAGSSHVLLERARMLKPLERIETADPAHGACLPFEDNSISAIVIGRWPGAVKYNLLLECQRVLQQNGLLVLVTLNEDAYEHANKVFTERVKPQYRRQLGRIKNLFELSGLKTFSRDVVLQLMDSNGFVVPKWMSILSLHPTSAEEYFRQCEEFFGMDRWLMHFPEKAREHIKNGFHRALLSEMRDGDLHAGASLQITFGVKAPKQPTSWNMRNKTEAVRFAIDALERERKLEEKLAAARAKR